MMRFSKATGISLIEMLLVLVVASLMLIVSVRYFSSANAAKKRASVVLQMNRIFDATQSYLNAGTNPETVLIASQGNSVLVDNHYIALADTVSPWHTDVGACWGAGNGCDGNQADTLQITISGVPADDCAQLLSALTKSTVSSKNTCNGDGRVQVLTVYYQLF